MGLLIDGKRKNECRVPTVEKLDDIGAILENTARKLLECLAQETGVSKSRARRLTQLLKLRSYKTTVIHAFQLCDPAGRVHLCSWSLQSVIVAEINPHLHSILMKNGFTCKYAK
jgi:hypothetical protein